MSERYQILRKIGQGGVGTVYLAEDTSLSRQVAIKKLKPATEVDKPSDSSSVSHGSPESLLHEAKTLSALQHPNIVTVFDIVEDSEGLFVVMEYLSGETLEQTVEKAPLPLSDFFKVGIESLDALSAAHRQGILHRDIKSSNLMLVWDDSGLYRVKILDFGLAKLTREPALQTMDQSGAILGTIHFMAPEQFERDLLDQRTDLYALGCVLYHALSRRYPFDGESAPQVMASHLQHIYQPICSLRPDIPHEVANWIDRMIARKPDDRIQGSEEAQDDLKDLRRRFFEGKLTISTDPQELSKQAQTAHAEQPSPGGVSLPTKMGSSQPDQVLLPTVRLTPPAPAGRTKSAKIPWLGIGITAVLLAVGGFWGWKNFANGDSGLPTGSPGAISAASAEHAPALQRDTGLLDSGHLAFSPFAVAEIMDKLGESIVVEGTINRVGESKSGKTRYLNFSWPPGDSVPLAVSVTTQNDREFSMTKLETLTGKSVRAHGEIESIFGKPQLKLSKWADLEVLP